jgi:hypothetical protein
MEGGATRGFAACWNPPNIIYRVSPNDPVDEKTNYTLVRIPGRILVDGEKVNLSTNFPEYFFSIRQYIFERDEYVFELQNFDFGVMGGDVK